MRLNRPKLAIVAALALGVLVAGTSPAAADMTVNVNTTFDETTVGDGSCSLREAVLFANALPGGEDCGSGQPPGMVRIVLPAGHYGLAGGVLDLERIGGPIAIQGAGAGSAGTTIDAQHISAVFDVFGQAQITGVTITGGRASTGSDGAPGHSGGQGPPGGGILNHGTLALTDATVTGNASGDGGPAGDGTSSLVGGSGGTGGLGGGIWNAGTLSLTDVTVSANRTGAGGAGGVNDPSCTLGFAGVGGTGGFGGGSTTTPLAASCSPTARSPTT